MPETHKAGDGVSDEEMAKEVAEQTPSEEREDDFFEREKDGTMTDTEAAKADADELE